MKTTLLEVIDFAQQIDEVSAVFCEHFALDAKTKEEHDFWNNMAENERDHLAHWATLRTMAEYGVVPQILGRPFAAKAELASLLSSGVDYFKRYKREPGSMSGFIVSGNFALQKLNSYTLSLMHYYNEHLADEGRWEFQAHLERFLMGLESFGRGDPELELLAKTIRRLFEATWSSVESSTTDELTGALNRHGFRAGLAKVLSLARRHDQEIGLLLVGLDGFSAINQERGPEVGDEALRNLSQLLGQDIRQSDLFARYGGVEFALCLNGVDNQSLPGIAESLRLRSVAFGMENKLPVDAMVGAYHGRVIDQDVGGAIDRLTRRAERSLRQARQQGTGQIVINA